VPIDVRTPLSPGWWMQREFNRLNDRRRRNRLDLLHDTQRGRGPLPTGQDVDKGGFSAFAKMARTVYGPLITGAVSDGMRIGGFKSAVDDDVTGDAVVGRVWKRARMKVISRQVHDKMLTLGESFVIVGLVDEETKVPLITAEDPRFMVAEAEAGNPHRLLAALKVLHDDTVDEDRAYLYLPGQVLVARKKTSIASYSDPDLQGFAERRLSFAFDPKSWEWDEQRSGVLPHQRMPVVRFSNHDGMGEFEAHLDIMERINQQVLQRMVIATMQAWRQRAVKGLPDVYPEDHAKAGEPIDYSDVFTSDPGAFWQLPETAAMWESQPVDLRPLLDAVKDDVIALASVTKTPLHMLQPGGDNQSAEGAASQRDGLTSKTEDRIDLVDDCWTTVMSLALEHLGDTERANPESLEAIWAPAYRPSLAERGDAAAKAQNDMPRRTRLIKLWGLTPDEADKAMSEWEDEQLAAQLAAQTAAAAGDPAGGQPVPDAGGDTTGTPVGETSTRSTPTTETDRGVTAAKAA
jgi:hypothetical protein